MGNRADIAAAAAVVVVVVVIDSTWNGRTHTEP